MDKQLVSLILIIILVVSVIATVFYWAPVWETNGKLHKVATIAEKNDSETGDSGELDAWKNPIHIIRINDQENNRIIYTARSAGRDEIMDNDDDLLKVRIDVNWSKRAGKGAMDMGKEFYKGLKENIKKESKFEKE